MINPRLARSTRNAVLEKKNLVEKILRKKMTKLFAAMIILIAKNKTTATKKNVKLMRLRRNWLLFEIEKKLAAL